MRLTLVILYFAVIYYVLRPPSPVDLDIAALAPPPRPEAGRQRAPPLPDPQRTEASQVPARSAPQAVPDADDETPEETAATALTGAIADTDEQPDEQAGEQRTSTRAPEIELDMRDAN